ncbi:MAG: hypothetical protein WCC17_01110 [Candidatus Nitrosopolaris sp.]
MRTTTRSTGQYVVTDLKAFVAASVPTTLMFGMRHALDIDHISAIDNLVRMYNAKKGSMGGYWS